jgi:hypothetical protein
MRLFIPGALLVAILGLALSGCIQAQGERCQRSQDCDGLLCVNSTGEFPADLAAGGACTEEQDCGHCCPDCSTGSPRWDVSASQCSCTSPTVDGDADSDVDADAESDAAADADADDGGAPDADG